jgi:hypothetical protein
MVRKFLFILFSIGLLGCSPEVEIGYQPPMVPIRVSINTHGELKVGLSGRYTTPIGTFDIGGGMTVTSIRGKYEQKVLIVRVDDDAAVYTLEEGKEFDVVFDDSNTLYKKVALKHESDGDIVLELESAPPPDPPIDENNSSVIDESNSSVSNSNNVSCPGAVYPTRLVSNREATICTKVDRLIIRRSAGMNASEILSLYPGTTIKILKGPVCSDDFWWWKIEIYPGTLYGLQDRGFDPIGTTDRTIYGWAREGWDNKDTYFICQ